MFSRKALTIIASALLIATLLLGGSSPVRAQGGGNGNGPPPKKITQKDRQAAADRAAAAGLTLEAMAAPAPLIDGAPHYFSHPNYANSPLRQAAAPLVEFVGDGTGAAATATVDQTGVITELTLGAGGSGYTVAPTVVFTGTTGTGAAATATISGTVSALTLDSGGSGYTGPITVTITGDGAGAVATAAVTSNGFVSGINVTQPGSGYLTATVEITGDGSGAAAVANLSGTGSVSAITLGNGGSGYISPTVTINGDGSGASATAIVAPVGFVTGINVTAGGTGYISPTITINGDGSGASATASLSGQVTAIDLVDGNGGAGYTAPVVEIIGDGSGASATATVTPIGFVSAINITRGATYNNGTAPAVTITGNGTGAEAVAILDANNALIAIEVTAPGTGYDANTTVAVQGRAQAAAVVDTTSGPITEIVVDNGGSGYTTAPTVNIIDATGTGANAAATVTMSIDAITVTGPGAGYTNANVVINDPTGTGAAADAVLDTVSGPITEIVVDNGGSGYTTAPAVNISDATGTGAIATATVTLDGGIASITVTDGGSGYSFATVAITGDGAGAAADAVVNTSSTISELTLVNGGSGYTAPPTVSFIDAGGTGAGAAATAAISGTVSAVTLDSGGSDYLASPGIRKFVDGLAGLGPDGANNLGQYISIAHPDTITYPGADYYEIALVEFEEQLHSDLPPTKLRGYVQLNNGTDTNGQNTIAPDPVHYLGAAIITQKDRPVRIKFHNLLPTGAGGDLFIPVDSTVMGSGTTADGHMLDPTTLDPQNPMCSQANKTQDIADGNCFADNRATLHLHGGISPWISDGTPHQWITPAGENTKYPQGVSVKPVPDMGDSGDPTDGVMTFYYTNQQSARLMFYHDHAWGITRLNVYAGEAAPYIITDDTEASLVNRGLIPGAAETIPLVVQDKTFVPSQAQLDQQDETWDSARWGGEGSLWVPHVYSPAQNPGDASGVNQFGRWAYGPWFWPPTNDIDHGPVDNPYYDPACNPDVEWCEPSLMPGTPYISMGMEAFNDTPIINGTVYPTLTLEPKSYRFRILNAANDRFFNLSLYKAASNAEMWNPDGTLNDANAGEVALNPAEVAAALTDPAGVFPTPVSGTEGPDWIDIATEGGFLPAPVVIPPHPTTWVTDPTVFNAGNVDQHSLLIAPAERHDVIVDFSQYAGQTLILYNDAPAAFPARDPRYDYYTGNPDLRDTGGAPSTLPGYGPNTRTIMQIKIADAPAAPAFDLAALNAAYAHQPDGSGVFESGQHPIIVGQGAYNSAYGTSFTGSEGLVQIYDTALTFSRLVTTTAAGPPYATSTAAERLSMSLKPKMIQDEMGEAFELEYGRMSGFLGVETPNAQAGLQNMILHPYTYPPDEIIDGIELPPGVEVTPIASADDGTQIWKITHNGVDTHPIHWHLYDVQLINRVGWDGIIRKPEASELGWKDTIRVSPLEDTIVALRPIIPQLPAEWNGLPNSIRLLDPSMPEGMYLKGANTTQREAAGLPLLAFNPDGEPVDIVNHYVNFGWEYVFHCHILSHEEMDMMHAQVVGIAPPAPSGLAWARNGTGTNQQYDLTWIDNSKNETAFVIERRVAGSTDAWAVIATVQSSALGGWPYIESGVGPGMGTRTYIDPIGNDNNDYEYQVYAINIVGDNWDYSDPGFNEILPGGGWPTLMLSSGNDAASPPPANTVANPSNLTAGAAVKNKKTATVNLSWQDNSDNETGFLIQRADNSTFSLGVVNATVVGNVTTLSQNVSRGKTYYYRVAAFNDAIGSGWSNTVNVTTP